MIGQSPREIAQADDSFKKWSGLTAYEISTMPLRDLKVKMQQFLER